jgi:hypothetical protein
MKIVLKSSSDRDIDSGDKDAKRYDIAQRAGTAFQEKGVPWLNSFYYGYT